VAEHPGNFCRTHPRDRGADLCNPLDFMAFLLRSPHLDEMERKTRANSDGGSSSVADGVDLAY
jgi:hypothetical protein